MHPHQNPTWLEPLALLARVSGLVHDVGKATQHFQGKLVRATTKTGNKLERDLYRHEWISALFTEHWWSAVEAAGADESAVLSKPFKTFFGDPDGDINLLNVSVSGGGRRGAITRAQSPITSIRDALVACVVTHHRLMNPADRMSGNPKGLLIAKACGQKRLQAPGQCKDGFYPGGNQTLPEPLLKKLYASTRELQTLFSSSDPPISADYFRALTLLSRIALVAGDHEVSGWQYPEIDPEGAMQQHAFYANTTRFISNDGGAQSALNQPLDYHLREVGRRAQHWAYILADIEQNLAFQGLSEESRRNLARPSELAAFSWQDKASCKLRSATGYSDCGSLVFNLAGTGTGKTLANIKLVNALTPEDRPCRFSVALNLRSLTLQTAEALKRAPVRLKEAEINCLIGDRLTKAFRDTLNTDEDDPYLSVGNEGNQEPLDLAIEMGTDNRAQGPCWLDKWAVTKSKPDQVKAFQATPALISTTDYLVCAGDPSRQGHHVMAALRVASSDLILDEIDGYDPKALVSIARVVMTAALFGRNVIASSATLGEPMMACIAEAFATGIAMRQALYQLQALPVQVAFVDDAIDPEVLTIPQKGFLDHVKKAFSARTERLMSVVTSRPARRLGYIHGLSEHATEEQAFAAFAEETEKAINQLHDNHSWKDPKSEAQVSFGVIRVAHTKQAIRLARHLQALSPEATQIYAMAYHGSDLKARRALKEAQLDRMFSRANNAAQPCEEPEIQRLIRQAGTHQVAFVMVATPVEEVGRDHDFDWAIIEPSSIASIVQMAGRVRRHRQGPVNKPNVALMERNIKGAAGKSKCFSRPGNGLPYESHSARSLSTLLMGAFGYAPGQPLKIDAAMRFGFQGQRCRLSNDDDEAYRREYHSGQLVCRSLESHTSRDAGLAWLVKGHYHTYQLREPSEQRTFCIRKEGSRFVIKQQSLQSDQWAYCDSSIFLENNLPTWATPSIQAATDIPGLSSNIKQEELLSFSVFWPGHAQSGDRSPVVCFDELLGGATHF